MLKKLEKGICRAEVVGAMAIVVIMLGATILRLILRNYAESSTSSSLTETITQLMPHGVLSLGFLGASIGLSRGEAIAMDLLARWYPAPVRAFIARLTSLTALIIISVFIYLAFGYRAMDDSWPVSTILIPGLVLIAFKLGLRIYDPQGVSGNNQEAANEN
ncbi:MAG: TRAP transporter small permease subunit [Leptospiraceae bacterium]|nr:TRAP transporter small permease subunit [Leptospiraceae bacterium]